MPEKPAKKYSNQPKHHAPKTRAAVKIRRKKIIQGVIAGKTYKQVGIEVGLSPKTAEKQVGLILEEPAVKQSFQALLDKVIPDAVLSEKINFLLKAKEIKYFADKGIVTDQREVEALGIQADMVKTVAKLKGHWIDRQDIDVAGKIIIIESNV